MICILDHDDDVNDYDDDELCVRAHAHAHDDDDDDVRTFSFTRFLRNIWLRALSRQNARRTYILSFDIHRAGAFKFSFLLSTHGFISCVL